MDKETLMDIQSLEVEADIVPAAGCLPEPGGALTCSVSQTRAFILFRG